MTKKERLRREKARRSMFDLKELVIDVLAEHRDGLYSQEVADKAYIALPKGIQDFGYERANLAKGILAELLGEERVEYRTRYSSDQHKRWFLNDNNQA